MLHRSHYALAGQCESCLLVLIGPSQRRVVRFIAHTQICYSMEILYRESDFCFPVKDVAITA